MIFVTGNCHGDCKRFSRKHFPQRRQMSRDDCMIILGNFGGVWSGSSEERQKLDCWLFGHYHDNRTIDSKHILLWENIIQLI